MSRVSSMKALILAVVSLTPNSFAFGQFDVHTPPSVRPQQRRQQGFFDYALGKVNPNAKDYGDSMQSGRNAVVQHSVDDLYFWSNVVTLLLLTGACGTVLLQWRSADKKEVVAAALITELWNGRVSDRVEIDRRTEQFNALVQSHNAEVERALLLRSQTQEAAKDGDESLNRNVQKVATKGALKVPKGDTTQIRVHVDRAPADFGEQNIDPEQERLLLQRRLEALQNSEQNLKQRLNQTTLLLDQERRRNGSLKGA